MKRELPGDDRRRYRVLFIHPGAVISSEPARNLYYHLSEVATGDLLTKFYSDIPGKSEAEARRLFTTALGDFGYYAIGRSRLPSMLRSVSELLSFVAAGARLIRQSGRYDAIVSYGPFVPGLAARLLSAGTNTPLIVEIPGNPIAHAFIPGFSSRVKQHIAKAVVSYVVQGAAAVRLLYPSQLDAIRTPAGQHVAVFHGFVPISTLHPQSRSENYILFTGFPWHLKGVDILIRAFHLISDDFPECHLRILGHCPDRRPFEALRAGHPRIKFLAAVPQREAHAELSNCSVFVLPSRSEGMGRVLLEAMAAQKPIIASRVDGIPFYIRDGVDGLLFESENVPDLAAQLRRVLSDPPLAQRLARTGHRKVKTLYSEAEFVLHFKRLLEAVTAYSRAAGPTDER